MRDDMTLQKAESIESRLSKIAASIVGCRNDLEKAEAMLAEIKAMDIAAADQIVAIIIEELDRIR